MNFSKGTNIACISVALTDAYLSSYQWPSVHTFLNVRVYVSASLESEVNRTVSMLSLIHI